MSRAWLVAATLLAALVLVPGWAFALSGSGGYPAILFAPLCLGTVSAVVGVLALRRRRPRAAGVALLLSSLAVPTFFAAALNLPLFLLALVLLVRSSRLVRAIA